MLEQFIHQVDSVSLGSSTSLEGGHLQVSRKEALALLCHPSLAEVKVSWVSAGASARIVKVLDAVEPRAKAAGGGGVFPGFLGPAAPQGTGRTHILRGVSVLCAGYLPRAQEAIADMSGPAAPLSPLGRLHNLVVEFTPSVEPDWEQVAAALRVGMLRLAAHLAERAIGRSPEEVRELHAPEERTNGGGGCRVGVVTNLQTQGPFREAFVYGSSFAQSLPTLIDPNDLEDGAVVSGVYSHPALKNPTYLYQNHPVIHAVRARESEGLSLGGIVLSPEPMESLIRKELVSAHVARLCASARFDAVVVTKEGGGNADADLSLKLDEFERIGIPAVGIAVESSGPEGAGPPLVAVPAAETALVSAGNTDEQVSLPAMEASFGGERVDFVGSDARAAIDVPLAALYCALSPLGWGHLRCGEAA